jgi:hypothetical protein
MSLLQEPQRKEVQRFGKTWFEEGVEKGEQKGQRELLLTQLQTRFSPLSDTARQRPEAWPAEKLKDLGRALLTAESLRELGLED